MQPRMLKAGSRALFDTIDGALFVSSGNYTCGSISSLGRGLDLDLRIHPAPAPASGNLASLPPFGAWAETESSRTNCSRSRPPFMSKIVRVAG